MTQPPAENAAVLVAKGVHKSYRDGERTLEVLTGVDLSVKPGEFISIMGQSGSGKSTLLHVLGALDAPTKGEVLLSGRNYKSLGSSQAARLRSAEVGFIFQFHHLLPEFTALENVLIPGMIQRRPTGWLIDRATQLLRSVGLGERLLHVPSKLSGGEQQRVALARSIMNDPKVVLADEPTGDLDQKTGQQVMDFILKQTVGQGRSLVMATHDPGIAGRANRCYRLDAGRLSPAG